jgi:hypothetical protein
VLEGPGPDAFIQQAGSGGSGGSSPGTPVGGDAPALYCANIDISDPSVQSVRARTTPSGDSILPLLKIASAPPPTGNIPPPPNSGVSGGGAENTITIAVLDEGDSTTQKPYVRGVSQTCLPDPASKKGWNFVAGSDDTHDDSRGLHGSKVTQFIIDQARQYAAAKQPATDAINILPVKVFDSNGKGKLYNILCGISYAANSGAKIINASFGFYEYADTPANRSAAVLLQEHLAHYLPKNNILMIAAAGNDNPHEDTLYRNITGNPFLNPRDLIANPFYPAWLVEDPELRNNLLVVTTVNSKKDSVSPLQNFSDLIVDIGVNCDAVADSAGIVYYIFRDPIFTQPYPGTDSNGNSVYYLHTVTGTSFATPIVTGKIAAYYTDLVKAGPLKKSDILSRMLTTKPFGSSFEPLLQHSSGKLINAVKDGNTSFKKDKK